MLSNVKEVAILQESHIDAAIAQLNSQFNSELAILEKFTIWVKTERAMKQLYFNFHHLPDLILAKQITKKDYKTISRLLLKVKAAYLSEKAKSMPDKRIEDLNVTDEDLVPLSLFDMVLA